MNWNLYDIKGHYPTKYSIDQHNDLISRKKGSNLWVNKLILSNPTIYLTEIIKNYQLVEDQGLFFKYKKSNLFSKHQNLNKKNKLNLF